MKRTEIQGKAKERLRALNIIGIDRATLQKAKAEIESVEEGGVPSEGIPLKGIPSEGIPFEGIPEKANVDIASNFCKVDADVLDKALPTMDVYEQSIYIKLYRLSYGYGKNWCITGYGSLVRKCGMKRNGVINAVKRLEESGWIQSIEFDRSRGTTYRVFLPCEMGMESKTIIKQKGVSLEGIPLNGIPPEGIPSGGIPPKSIQGVPFKGIPSGDTPARKAASGKEKEVGIPLKGIPSEGPLIEDPSIDLSLRGIVSEFYRGIGQSKISKAKRERAEKGLQELLKDGFNPADIHFAVGWTLENAKEEPYDFSVIKHTIGQAMAAKKEVEEAENRKREEEQEAARKQEEEEIARKERERIEACKAEFGPEQRADLRERALEEIRKIKGIREEFISEMLIEAKENEILRGETEN